MSHQTPSWQTMAIDALDPFSHNNQAKRIRIYEILSDASFHFVYPQNIFCRFPRAVRRHRPLQTRGWQEKQRRKRITPVRE